MKMRAMQFVATFLTLIPIFAGQVMACACCAEPGTYVLHSPKTDSYYTDVVSEFRYAAKANLYETEAGFEMIKGLESVEKEAAATSYVGLTEFSVRSVSFRNGLWKFEFLTMNGTPGSVTLPLPPKLTEYKVDTRENKDEGLGPLLYKELRFEGRVRAASGFLKGSAAPNTKFNLVFQGRGRGCLFSEEFKHWRLAIEGQRADFAIYGSLKEPVTEAPTTKP